MDPRDAVFTGIIAIVVCVPVLALTARLTLKPIVDSIVRLRETVSPSADPAMQHRLLQMEDEMRQLRGAVSRLDETVEFQQKLLGRAPEAPVLSSASSSS